MQKQPSRLIVFSALCAGVSGAVLGAASGFADVHEKAHPAAAAPARKAGQSAAGQTQLAQAARGLAGGAREQEQERGLAGGARKQEQERGLAGGAREQESAHEQEPAQGVLNGYKGYRYHRPGYKSAGDGWWYPRAAFAKKAARETLLQKPKSPAEVKPAAPAAEQKAAAGKAKRVKPRKAPGLSAAHKSWCASHRSFYNPRDNTYGTLLNQRKTCISPYFHN